jgi:hypothetical protein
MAERGLRHVQQIRRLGQSARLMDRPDRSEMTKLDMHYEPASFKA